MSGLNGKTVAILEARRSAELAKLLQQRGGDVFIAPAMREETVDETGEIARFIDEACANSFDLVLCLTGAGIRALFAVAEKLERRDELYASFERVPLLCRGPKPVAALRALGLRETYTTPSPYTTVQVLEVLQGIHLGGKTVGVVLHGGPSLELTEALAGRGAMVHEVRVYSWRLPADIDPIQGLIDQLQAGAIDAVAFTSASQVENLFAIAEDLHQAERLHSLLWKVRAVVAVGPVCAKALRDHDLRVDVEPVEPKMGPMVLEIERFFSRLPTSSSPLP